MPRAIAQLKSISLSRTCQTSYLPQKLHEEAASPAIFRRSDADKPASAVNTPGHLGEHRRWNLIIGGRGCQTTPGHDCKGLLQLAQLNALLSVCDSAMYLRVRSTTAHSRSPCEWLERLHVCSLPYCHTAVQSCMCVYVLCDGMYSRHERDADVPKARTQ